MLFVEKVVGFFDEECGGTTADWRKRGDDEVDVEDRGGCLFFSEVCDPAPFLARSTREDDTCGEYVFFFEEGQDVSLERKEEDSKDPENPEDPEGPEENDVKDCT